MENLLIKIEQLRRQIDETDKRLVKLLNRRAQYADKIGQIKRSLNMPVYVPQREEQVIAHIQASNPGPLSNEALKRLYERIIDESRRLESDNYQKRLLNNEDK